MVLLCDSQVLRARNRGRKLWHLSSGGWASQLHVQLRAFRWCFPIHILSYFEYINKIWLNMDLEYIIQFISICLSYFDVSHFEIWTESEYIYICIYLKTKKVVHFPIFNGWRSRNIWITENPFLRLLFYAGWIVEWLWPCQALRHVNSLTYFVQCDYDKGLWLFHANPKISYRMQYFLGFRISFTVVSQQNLCTCFYTQRSRYTAVYSWPFGCSSHWASSIYR